jgi:hypothetical protein
VLQHGSNSRYQYQYGKIIETKKIITPMRSSIEPEFIQKAIRRSHKRNQASKNGKSGKRSLRFYASSGGSNNKSENAYGGSKSSRNALKSA